MITKKVNRYYCEFCKKSGCSAGAMKKHELHCTMNPKRVCRMCGIVGGWQVGMDELLACIPEAKAMDWIQGEPSPATEKSVTDVKDAITKLREMTSGCPACILSALRQSGIDSYYWMGAFDYKAEMATAMHDYREAQDAERY